MMFIGWFFLCLLDLLLQIVAIFAAPILSLFTANGWPSWGEWFWTYDNPPQGDRGYQRERAPYCPASTTWRRYINRVFWLYRNPTYGFAKKASVGYGAGLVIVMISSSGAGSSTSDKYRKAGHYYVKCYDIDNNVIAFEYYLVKPYSANKCIRIRLGWKLVTDKFKDSGFAPLVHCPNPFKAYG